MKPSRNSSPKLKQCRRCRFFAPPARCLDQTTRSGRCGDWIYYKRGRKQCRRRYARPKDPHTLEQMRCRGRLTAASRNYSGSLTDEQQDACIAAGSKLRSRPRLGQSGSLTGQQYWVRGECGQKPVQSKVTKVKNATQAPQSQRVTESTWGSHRGIAGVPPGPRRPRTGEGEGRRKKAEGRKGRANGAKSRSYVHMGNPRRRIAGATRWRAAGRTRRGVTPPGHVWYTQRATRNTITVRLRRPKAEVAAKARPNLNAWVNQLIEQALSRRVIFGPPPRSRRCKRLGKKVSGVI